MADSRRMDILRQLMASPATLIRLAPVLKKSPAWIRHPILALESAKLIEVSEIKKTGSITEKFYRAKTDALPLQEIILPKTKKPAVIFSDSHDLALESVAESLLKHLTLLTLPVGSLDGLINLRQGLCHISGSHLLDESGEYNAPFVRHIFPERNVKLVTFAHRTQGLMVAKGNPLSIRGISDIAKLRVRFVNRNSGSGTRVWFDTELRKLESPTEKIHGYDKEVMTHGDAAVLIANDRADVSLGLQAAAHRIEREIERADGRDHSHGTASPEAEIFLSAWSCVQLNCRLLHLCILVGCVSSFLPINSVMGSMLQNTILPMKR